MSDCSGSGRDGRGASALPHHWRRSQSGQEPSLGPQVERPLERRLLLDCCQSVCALPFCRKCGVKKRLEAAPLQGSCPAVRRNRSFCPITARLPRSCSFAEASRPLAIMSPDLEFKPCRLLPLRGMYGLSRGASASSGLPYRVVLLGGSADSASHLTPEAKAYFPNAQGIDPGKNLLSHLAPRTTAIHFFD